MQTKTPKTVLVCFENHKRRVTFTGGPEELKDAVYRVFHDVLAASTDIFFQIRVEEPNWEGVYVDLVEQDSVPDRSWIKVCVSEVEDEPSAKAAPSLQDQVRMFIYVEIVFVNEDSVCISGQSLARWDLGKDTNPS